MQLNINYFIKKLFKTPWHGYGLFEILIWAQTELLVGYLATILTLLHS